MLRNSSKVGGRFNFLIPVRRRFLNLLDQKVGEEKRILRKYIKKIEALLYSRGR